MRSLRLQRLNELLAVSCFASLFMVGSLPCEGNLGDTPEQIKARYGEVTYKFLSPGTCRFRRPGVETDTIDVTFQDGKSQKETYLHWKSKALADRDSTGGFSNADIDSALKANAQGLTWRKQTPNPKSLAGGTTWLLGSNDPKTALAKAVSNNETHMLTLSLMSYDVEGSTDAATAAKLNELFPAPKETPEPVRAPVPLKSGGFPVLKMLGQPQPTMNELFGVPSNHRPIHKPDKFDGGTEVEYADGTSWTLLTTGFYHDQLRWIEFFFRQPLPASEDELFKILGLSKNAFRITLQKSYGTEYRGVADKRVITITAWHPDVRDGVGFCHKIDIELIETLD